MPMPDTNPGDDQFRDVLPEQEHDGGDDLDGERGEEDEPPAPPAADAADEVEAHMTSTAHKAKMTVTTIGEKPSRC
jgi:hypothetical protein